MGFGLSEESYAQSYNYARVAIDLSLARGGDQAVIKDSQGITYYGGKREQTSKNTRVKARVKAEALREFITRIVIALCVRFFTETEAHTDRCRYLISDIYRFHSFKKRKLIFLQLF